MTLTLAILLVLALYLIQIFLQETSRFHFDLIAIVGNRDRQPEPGVIAARLDRAKTNMLEALPLFVPLALLALIRQGNTGAAVPWATAFLALRALYVPAYVSGLPWLRSIIWFMSVLALFAMALTLL